ncbi:hypothetical protein L3X38_031861 [Prunus dulcis]|uniref:Transposable element protein n=1 Tax=Prunus dulcis TaxID=3755 RepID=A0AAD4VEE1_PRUDU|nr:hypothetical protein L3X38_031861 [Prunus dulcis]
MFFILLLHLPSHHTLFFPTQTSLLPTPNFSHGSLRPLKLDLERFSEDDPYGWIASAEHFLKYYGVPDEDKVIVPAVHLSGDASLWMCWFEQRFPKDWTFFTTSLLQYFGSTDMCDFEASLSHVQQTGSLADYLTLFTKLACRASEWPDVPLPEPFTPVPLPTPNHTPTTLLHLCHLYLHPSPYPLLPATSPKPKHRSVAPRASVLPATRNTDLVIVVSSPCLLSLRPLFRMMTHQYFMIVTRSWPLQSRFWSNIQFPQPKPCYMFRLPSLSLCPPNPIHSHMGTITHARHHSKPLCPDSRLLSSNFKLLPVSGCDILLGAEWLETLGLIEWDFKNKIMHFHLGEHSYCLTGIHSSPTTAIDAKLMTQTLLAEPEGFLAQLILCLPDHGDNTTTAPPLALHHLLHTFSDLFNTPAALPPPCHIDHRIPLLPGATPVNVRPYRYPHLQKSEIESLIHEMLAVGIIRPSASPYSSPVLLISSNSYAHRRHHKTAFHTHDGHYEFLVMPFSFSNAPSTFQSLMNDLFRPHLRRFVLVFFDDILIYNESFQDHITHLQTVFEILRTDHLFVKKSKCVFAQPQIEYLGHTISCQGIAMDQTKIDCIQTWSKPSSPKSLSGFLGLAGYYRKFVRNFGFIARPLTQLLKKDNFVWNHEADAAFAALKNALSSTPVLQLPDFSKQFTIECDASQGGLGAVLSQNDHPIALLSKPLSGRNLALSVYEKETMSVIFAIKKWLPYLLGQQFRIITDHQTLRHFLDQRITTLIQQRWLLKLMGYNFVLHYRPGSQNSAADALSQRHELLPLLGISQPIFTYLDTIKEDCHKDLDIHSCLSSASAPTPPLYLRDFRGKITPSSTRTGCLFLRSMIGAPKSSRNSMPPPRLAILVTPALLNAFKVTSCGPIYALMSKHLSPPYLPTPTLRSHPPSRSIAASSNSSRFLAIYQYGLHRGSPSFQRKISDHGSG